jgi:hypothetical protein
MYNVIEKYQDMSGKYLVRVAINEDETIFLNFDADPSAELIETETQKMVDFLAALEEERNPEE